MIVNSIFCIVLSVIFILLGLYKMVDKCEAGQEDVWPMWMYSVFLWFIILFLSIGYVWDYRKLSSIQLPNEIVREE